VERAPRYADTRVESIEVLRGSAPVVVAPPPAGADMYRVTVRKPDGSFETYVMQSLGTLRAGDRVRIVNGTIYPARISAGRPAFEEGPWGRISSSPWLLPRRPCFPRACGYPWW
jgi:hypothetical protein